MQRALLTDFALKNPYYAAASVTVYEVNENLQQTATVATLYAGPIGATLRPNPIALDSEGKFPGPIYVEKPVIMVVTPAGGAAQVLGVTGLIPRWRGIWTSATLYYPSERVRDPAGPATFIVLNGHVSNSFAADVAAGLLQEEIDADAMTDALAGDVLGTVIPVTPASAFLRINAGGNGLEARTPAQVRGDIAAVNRAGDTMSGALLLPGFDPVAANEATRKAYVDALVAAVIAQARRPGEITAFAMSSAPTGWLFCDGSAVSRTTYAALFAEIGTAHGIGDGATTFNLPDYRGMFLRGFDAGRGVDSGRAFASFQDDEIESHAHGVTITDPGHQHWSGVNNGGGGDYYGASSPANRTNNASARYSLIGGLTSDTSHLTSTATTGITASAGNTGGAETRPKNVAVYICIKT